jgi:hypothetical protein
VPRQGLPGAARQEERAPAKSVARPSSSAATAWSRVTDGNWLRIYPEKTVPDEMEFIDVRAFPYDTVLRMVLDGEIVDSMTVVAVLLAARRREAGTT